MVSTISKATLITYHQQITSHDKGILVKEEITVQSNLKNGTVFKTTEMKCNAQWLLGLTNEWIQNDQCFSRILI